MTPPRDLNLSSRPFVNRRPVRRLSVVLWAVAVLLTGLTSWLFLEHFSGTRLTGEQQVEIREQLRQERRRLDELQTQMASLDVASDNREAS